MKLTSLTLLSIFFLFIPKIQGTISLTTETLHGNQLNNEQWDEIRNLWMGSFFNAYKNLPLKKIDHTITDESEEALKDYLTDRFDKYKVLSLQDSYIFTLVYKDNLLIAYTLHHSLPKTCIIEIDHFAVNSNFQGQGVGKYLLGEVIKNNPDIESIVLSTRILNKPARKFYKNQGFYEIAHMEDVRFNPSYSILLKKDVCKKK